MEDLITHEEHFTVRSSEVSHEGKAKLQSICDLLQETAGNHALKLNFDISRLRENQLTWMLHRLHVQMDRFPEWRDRITIRTWPSSGDTLRAYRDFVIEDSDGKKLGQCLSYWLMINTETKRPVRMPEEVLKMAPANTGHVLDIKKSRIEIDQPMQDSKLFRVRRSDLDINQHVNNVKYIEWALEALPESLEINEIDIEFLAECTVGEEVKSEYTASEVDGRYLHQIIRMSDNKIAAQAVTNP